MLREVQIPGVAGRLFLTSMPGRYEPLKESLDELVRCATLVVLTSDEEITEKSPEYGRWLATRRLDASPKVLRYSVRDFGVPADVAGFVSLAKQVGVQLVAGEEVVVHCAAGIGRTGTFAACVLVLLGLAEDEALQRVRVTGSGPETEAQQTLVHSLDHAT